MGKITYKKSGVDVNKANLLIDRIKPLIASTKRDGWVGNIGAFAGLFKARMSGYRNPILVSSTDGVGTKLLIAQWANRHDTVGIDLVAMNVNDLICSGAEPLFFLDYFACGKLSPNVMYDVIKGIVKGCKMGNVALIGGETAELPGMYDENIYDLAGFTVGIVDRDKVIDGRKVKNGDIILGIQSSGIHSNGYSLVRKVFSRKELTSGSICDMVLKPTIIYVKPVLDLIKRFQVKGIAHITGGGFYDNIIRVLPKNTQAVIFKRCWDVPEIFDIIEKRGNIDDRDMFWTFNMGIGMILVISRKNVWKVVKLLNGKYKLKSWLIGEIVRGTRKVELIDL